MLTAELHAQQNPSFFSNRNTQLRIFIIFVCMNSFDYSLSTSAHVPQNFENGLEYLFNLK